MIHIVDPQTSEILDYITLDNIIDDSHKKSLESYLETYDAIVLGGEDFSYDKHLEKRNHIIIPDEDGTYQEFILFEVEKYRDTEGRKTHFYAHATYLELKKAKVIYPTRREGFTLSQHAGWALNDTGWTVGIVESEGVRTFNIENHTNPYEFLKQLANEFEVEMRFRVEHDGRRITARYVDFLERIGDWKGREVEFGKDLDNIRRIEKQDVVTALLGLGPEKEDGTRLEVLVEDEEALQRWGRVDEHGNLHHLIEPYEIESSRTEMTEEEARQYTRTALDKRINTQVTYETTILDLEEVPGLEHEKIRFGDTIRIKDTYFNPPLYLEARVYEIDRSIKNKTKKDIKLGDYIEYTEEEVNAIWNQLRNEIRRRLDRMAIVTINSTAGNVFKNAQGTTELTARTFVSGAERDEDGTLYDYQWMRFDKDGNHDTDFYAEGKTITVTANDIDEKATYRVLVAYELEVINTAEITISNVFDGEDGEPGPPGPKGDKGDPGPQGPPGTSVTSIVEYYLATDQNSGVTTDTPGWTTTMQQMTPQERFLWNYERINFSDSTYQNTNPVIIGVYGDEGEEGRSIVSITEYYLATSASSGVTRNTSGWTTTMQVTTPEKKYLWNYEKITWNKAPLETYTEPVIIGVHGEQGPKGEDGKTFYTWIKYADTPTSGMSDSPEGKEYIGIAYNKETPTPSTNYSDYIWAKFKGEQGIPGPPGEDGQPTYTWVKYADDENGNGMSDSPDGKLYIGLAFNKTTPEESNNPADYTWSLMPQNIEIGGRNLIKNSEKYVLTPKNTGQSSDNYNYAMIYLVDGVSLINGQKYTGSANVEITHGNFDRITVLSRKEGNTTNASLGHIPIVNGRIEFTFTANGEEALFLFYAGVSGETRGNGVIFTNVKIEKGDKATDWTPAPEDVQEQIDEAKQEAEEAKQEAQQAQTTADGKNSVFHLPTAPPTAGRKIGDIWFDTSRDNLMHRFDGTSWVQAKWGEQSIVANSITANHIKSLAGLNVNDQFIVDSQGNVKFAGSLQGASGTFGEVTAIDGDFFFQDANSQTKYGIIPKTNLITDHSFELAFSTGNVTSGGYFTSWDSYTWGKRGTPRLFSGYNTDTATRFMFGFNYIGVNNSNYIWTSKSGATLIEGRTYTFSSHFMNYTGSPTPRLRIKLMETNTITGNTTTLQTWEQTFPALTNGSKIVRHSITFTLTRELGFVGDYYRWVEFEILSGNSSWLYVDGVQLVEGDYPTVYEEESSLWMILNGLEIAKSLEVRGNIGAGDTSGYLNLRPGNNHGYIEFYRTSGRVAYVGVPSAGSEHFVINAEGVSGEIRLAGANVYVTQRLINPQAYNVTVQSPANVYVTSNGYFARSTSSKRYKADIQYNDIDYKKILKLQQASWVDRNEFENNNMSAEGLKRYYGAIAEDFERIGLSEYVVYNEETGEVENFSDRAWVLLIPNINDILKELEQIKERLERLENEGNSV